jgi:hypothetical protein
MIGLPPGRFAGGFPTEVDDWLPEGCEWSASRRLHPGRDRL